MGARLLTISYLMVIPFQLSCDLGLVVNVALPAVIATVLFAMDQLCTNLEDPFGDDPCDIKIIKPMFSLEVEMMVQLEETADPAFDYFEWRHVPADDEWMYPRGVPKYLCLGLERAAAEKME